MGWADAVLKSTLQPGQWKCAGCYVVNEVDVFVCVSCETEKKGHEGAVKALADAVKAKTLAKGSVSSKGFTFSGAAPAAAGGGAFSSGTKPAGSQPTQGFKFAATGGTSSAPSQGFSFNTTPAAAAAAPVAAAAPKVTAAAGAPASGWADMLKQKKNATENKWKCEACYVANDMDVFVCVSCETPKPGAEEAAKAANDAVAKQKTAATAAKVAAAGISFGAPSGAGAFKFGATDPKAAAEPSTKSQQKKRKMSEDIITVSFGEGTMGITFVSQSAPLVIKAISDIGLAADIDELKIGLVLTSVQGTDIAIKSYDETIALIKAAARPLELGFTPAGSKASSAPLPFAAAGSTGFTFPSGGAAMPMALQGDADRPDRDSKKYRLGVTTGSVIICGDGQCGQLGFGTNHDTLDHKLS